MKQYLPLLLWTIATGLGLTGASAAAVDKAIVYIECTVNGKTSNGTGVVVSPQGHVLTARHVISPDPEDPEHPTPRPGTTCKGSVAVAQATNNLIFQQPTDLSVDAALLRFADTTQSYEFMRFCIVNDWMIRREIFVAGFPAGTQTGVPSFRQGVLSTVFPNPEGLLETDGQTVQGMSGGPVFSHNLSGIIGIVIGASFTPQGIVRYYGVLPVSVYAGPFRLEESETPCYRQNREVELLTSQWRTGDAPVKLGVRAEAGVCFLGSVHGQFNDDRDSVSVELQDGEYVLNGFDGAGGQLGATARCIWYD